MEQNEANFANLKKSPSSDMVLFEENKKQVAVASPKRDMVKSTAVVKWSATQFPVAVSQLTPNTDLKDSPPNWLRSRSREEEHLKDLPWKRHSECSSFAMANFFPDYTGEVDVISDAENIKRLLKIPFESSHASLMVHRVGRTLLLDNFDIHQHLLRRESENWLWLYKFFKNTVMKTEDEMKYVPRQPRTDEVFQKKLMYSKFLYRSLMENAIQGADNSQLDRSHLVSTSPAPCLVIQHPQFVADHLPVIDMVQFEGQGEFHRQMLWTFEDLRMLIGADLPVFSVGDHPCVSLRLRDMLQPINVVTGLDYWLDNLMCNVPEVAMCYHDGGFVQKYELIKTEDIPKLESSKFNPQTVKDVASNILAFLRHSATKEGHTYWLYKCKRFDYVKLYDLTTLCGDSVPKNGVTPFTIPVAMLLYRVARKLRLKGSHIRHIPHIKALLQTSLRLLDEMEHAEVYTSAQYFLSDLYIPDGCLRNEWVADSPPDTASPDRSGLEPSTFSSPEEIPSEQNSDEEEDEKRTSEEVERAEIDRAEVSVSVKDLMKPPKEVHHPIKHMRLEGITGTPDERCKDGLQCVRKGLACLEQHLLKLQKAQRSSSIVEEQHTCNSSEAIPLKYASLQELQQAAEAGTLVLHSAVQQMESAAAATPATAAEGSWHCLRKSLLLRKASMANCVLANEFLANKQYGCSLRHLRYAVHCFEAMIHLTPSKKTDNTMLESQFLLTAAEVHHHLAQLSSFEDHLRAYDDMSEEDAAILESAKGSVPVPEMEWLYKWTTNRTDNLQTALRCLERVRDICRQQYQTVAVKAVLQDVVKKNSATYNELGKDAMHLAEAILSGAARTRSESDEANRKVTFADIEKVWMDGMKYFQQSLTGFCKVKDSRNEAGVLLNMIRLHKIAASAYMTDLGQYRFELGSAERHHFNEALEYYGKALECLGPGQSELRNTVLWDLSTTYLNLAIYLQKYPPASGDTGKEVAELFRKAIKKCQQITSEEGHDLWVHCRDRIATLEYNLGGLYLSAYINHTAVGKQSGNYEKAEAHFKKAAEHFRQLGKNYKTLQLQCKRLFLHQKNFGNDNLEPQSLHVMLEMVTDSQEALLEVASAGFAQQHEAVASDWIDPNDVLRHIVQPLLLVLRQLLTRAKRLKLQEEQQQLHDLYKKGLELSSHMETGAGSLEAQYRQAGELCGQIRRQYKWATSGS